MTSKAIAALNDAARKIPGKALITLTFGVRALKSDEIMEITTKTRDFNDFNENNDPNGEHDFGSFTVNDKKIFWKIDYYDLSMDFGSDNPADESVTKRVLTIMLADEY